MICPGLLAWLLWLDGCEAAIDAVRIGQQAAVEAWCAAWDWAGWTVRPSEQAPVRWGD